MTHADVLQPGDSFGRFKILGRLGAGGMGEVYRAHDQQLRRDLAIKVIPIALSNPEWRQRFEREASSAAALAHPNICTIFEFGEFNSHAYIAMELVEGEDLAARIRRGPLPVSEVVELGLQIADALSEAARKGIVHRDIKSANVMVSERGLVKVLDFGLAKQAAIDDAQTALTQTGAVMGTLAYMAPEQIRGQLVDHRSDLYAVGVILYELLTTRRPFDGHTAGEVAGAVLHEAPIPLERLRGDVPVAMRTVVMRLLEKDPAARYQTASDLRLALTAVSSPASAESSRFALPAWVGGPIVKAGALAVVVIVVTAGGWTRWGGSVRSDRGVPSLVILPAKVYGAPDFAYLSDAVPATLSNYLARVPGLDTRVPPTSEEMDRVGGDIGKVARAYGVNNALTSSVTAEGASLVLNVELVDPDTRTVVWSNEYSGSRDAYLQTVKTAAQGVQQRLVPGAETSISGIGNAATSEAELALRIGEYHKRRYSVLFRPEDFTAAYAAFQRALALDHTLADAAVEMAGLHLERVDGGQSTAAAAKPLILEWAQRALSINPRAGGAWAVLAGAELLGGQPDVDVMITHALKAAAFAPRCSNCHAAISESLVGVVFTLAVDAAREARSLDPLDINLMGNVAMDEYLLGRPSEAERVIAEARSIEPDSPWPMLQQAIILADLGRIAEARELLLEVEEAARAQRVLRTASTTARVAVTFGASIHGQPNPERIGQAITEVTGAVIDPGATAWDRLMQQLIITPFMVRSGRLTEAIELLNTGARLGAPVPLDWLLLNPHLEPLRKDPRFAQYMVGAQARFSHARTLLADASSRNEVPMYLVSRIRELGRMDVGLKH
jgi:TolB-like protein